MPKRDVPRVVVGILCGAMLGLVVVGLVSVVFHAGSGDAALAYLSHLEGSIGYVDVERAMRVHPLWAELEAVEKEMADTRSDWNKYLSTSMYYSQPEEFLEMMGELKSGQMEALRDQVEAEIARETARRQAELDKQEQEILKAAEAEVRKVQEEAKDRMQKDLDKLAKQLEKDMNTEANAVREKYQKDMLDIQVELALGKLSEESRKSKLQRLAGLQSELDKRLQEIERGYNRRLEEEKERLEKELQAEVAKKTEQISDKARSEAEHLRHAYTQELSEFVAAKESALQRMMQERDEFSFSSDELFLAGRKPTEIGIPSDAVKMQDEVMSELARRRDALHEAITEDIKSAATRLAEEHGMEAVVAQDEVTLGGVDVTELVINKLKG